MLLNMLLNVGQTIPAADLSKVTKENSPEGSLVWDTDPQCVVQIKRWSQLGDLCWISSPNGLSKVNAWFLRHIEFSDTTKAKLIEAKMKETEENLEKLKAELNSLITNQNK